MKNNRVANVDQDYVYLQDGSNDNEQNVIWTAVGEHYIWWNTEWSRRVGEKDLVNKYNQLKNQPNVFVPDQSFVEGDQDHPAGIRKWLR